MHPTGSGARGWIQQGRSVAFDKNQARSRLSELLMSPGNPAFPSPAPDTSAQVRVPLLRALNTCLQHRRSCWISLQIQLHPLRNITSTGFDAARFIHQHATAHPPRLPFVITPGIMRFGSFGTCR